MTSDVKTLLGIDVGTTGCKATLYTLDGQPLASGYAEHPLYTPRPGWVQENAEDWWRAVVISLRNIIADPGIVGTIAGIGVSCTNALVAVDSRGTPLRPAIMQLDQRTLEQADWLRNAIGEDKLFGLTGNRVAPGSFSAPLILWLKEHEPKIFHAAHKFLVPSGFIVHRLSGRFSMDYSRGSTTALFDIRKRAWLDWICDVADIPHDKLPDLYESSQVVGEVTTVAEKETGLPAGTPVVAGCMDTVGAAVGSGAILPQNSFAIMGTVGRIVVSVDQPNFDDRFLNCCHAVMGQWLVIGVMNGAGISFRWFRDQFGHMEVAKAHEMGSDAYDLFADQAAKSPPGAAGLIFLPYIAAERSPIWDPCARGVLFGLTVAHRRCDVIRAIMEGVALSLHHNLTIMKESMGIRLDKLCVGGGCTRSPVWNQIIADVIGHPLVTTRASETETLGAAVLAGVGTGVYKSFQEARERTLDYEREFVPRPEFASVYKAAFQLYRKLYRDLRPRFAEVAALLD